MFAFKFCPDRKRKIFFIRLNLQNRSIIIAKMVIGSLPQIRVRFCNDLDSVYNVPIDVDMNFDPNPILWTLENTLIPIRGHQTVPLL